jgi:SAM-dependent methyltransferase
MNSPGDYRLHPPLPHRDFLILTDLLAWLRSVLPATSGPVLDYGCGDSPYRSLFAGRPYARADVPGEKDLDFTIAPDETIAAPDGAFGTIVSTQVLEHVYLFREYLDEAHRVLAPGGTLLLSTHGTFEEHGHPHDHRRWTLQALSLDLERAGFVVERADKLTVGPRALGYLLHSQMWRLNPSRRSLLGFGLQLLRSTIARRPEQWNAFIDRSTASHAVVPGPATDETFYIGIAYVARKA